MRHRLQGPGRGHERRLERRGCAREDGERHHQGERSHYLGGEGGEQRFLDVRVSGPESRRADAGIAEQHDRDGEVGDHDHGDGEQCGPSGGAAGIFGLLVHREDDVPAPEHEDRQREAGHEYAEAEPVGSEERGVEPFQAHRGVVVGFAVRDLDDRCDHEPGQGDGLQADERVLDALGLLDASIRDVRGDPR